MKQCCNGVVLESAMKRNVTADLLHLVGKPVKVLYSDEGETRVVRGLLDGVNDNYIIVDGVVIGLGRNFISCIPKDNGGDQ